MRSVSRLEAVLDDGIARGQAHTEALNRALEAVEATAMSTAGAGTGPGTAPGHPAASPAAPPPAADTPTFISLAPTFVAPASAPAPAPPDGAETFELDLDGVPSGLDQHPPLADAPPPGHPAAPPPEHVVREVRLRVDDARKRVVPLAEWLGGLKQVVKPQLDSARRLGELAGDLQPLVLVVDDDSFQSKLLERLLGNAGYRTLVANSGNEALLLLGRQHPDLILMDVALPDLNGIELTRRLKANPATATIPIVMITGHSERQVFAASLKAGAVDFLVKPFDRAVLLQKLSHHLPR